jgi:osmotically-inducible protein OsmY
MTNSKQQHRLFPIFAVCGLLAMTACAPVVVGGAATAGVAVAQERTVGAAVDDISIQFHIKDKLLNESAALFGSITVDSIEGRVLLAGNVRLPDDRVEAVRIVWQVDGVLEVYNEIEVRERGSVIDYLKDVRIAGELRFKLLADRDVSAINYSVETVNGVIFLMGIAQSDAELERVTGHARTISGVQRVVSFVVLKTDPGRQG